MKDQWRDHTRTEHVVVDVNNESRQINDPIGETFEFTGTMVNWESDSTDPKALTGHVRWTIKANRFELIDEDWTNESDPGKES